MTRQPLPEDPQQRRYHQAYLEATQVYLNATDWVSFFREVLGVSGVVRRMFPSAEELAAFEASDSYRQIQEMLVRLRTRATEVGSREPLKVITVRLPQSLHELLRAEAHERHTSVNRLCISKLLQALQTDQEKGG